MSNQPLYRFKDIVTVPTAKDLVDIVLSLTQRKTPTQVHPQFKIGRIRAFYMRKVKFCSTTYHDRLASIIDAFPRLDDIHPFYSELINILYDRDHFKLALGQLSAVQGVIDNIAKDYVRLLKYADSPYKCKMLKRAALGRMCTSIKKLQASLEYLEQVRQNLSRMPSINPASRSLLLTGFPNVGKSSFINCVSQANVEVQPWPHTTKALYVGHFDKDYMTWQVIDTPGICEGDASRRNQHEWQAIMALAHIQATVLYILDLSEACGHSVLEQVEFFHSIKVLLKHKPLLIVANKIDLRGPDSLLPEEKAAVEGMMEGLEPGMVDFVAVSCLTREGIEATKEKACQMLLTQRVSRKVENKKADAIATRLYVTSVTASLSRPPCIPQGRRKDQSEMDKMDVDKPKLQRDIMEENGGAGVYSPDENKLYILEKEEWRYDVMPEIMDGKNIADFVDPDIEDKLRQLEAEEDAYLNQENMKEEDDNGWAETAKVLEEIHLKIRQRRLENRLQTSNCHVKMARENARVSAAKAQLTPMGYKIDRLVSRGAPKPGGVITSRYTAEKDIPDLMVVAKYGANSLAAQNLGVADILKTKIRAMQLMRTSGRKGALARSINPTKLEQAIPDPKKRASILKLKHTIDKRTFRGKQGESDHFIGTKNPRHLLSGKQGFKSDWR